MGRPRKNNHASVGADRRPAQKDQPTKYDVLIGLGLLIAILVVLGVLSQAGPPKQADKQGETIVGDDRRLAEDRATDPYGSEIPTTRKPDPLPAPGPADAKNLEEQIAKLGKDIIALRASLEDVEARHAALKGPSKPASGPSDAPGRRAEPVSGKTDARPAPSKPSSVTPMILTVLRDTVVYEASGRAKSGHGFRFQLRNDSTKAIDSLEVEILCFDESDRKVGTCTAFYENLAPGQTMTLHTSQIDQFPAAYKITRGKIDPSIFDFRIK
jgi:hypothetical protein